MTESQVRITRVRSRQWHHHHDCARVLQDTGRELAGGGGIAANHNEHDALTDTC